MDLISRYDHAGVFPFEQIKPVVTEILKTVISDGKGIEINTSGFRYGLSDTMPCGNILRLYRQLGGEIITIGSDSHRPEHLGTNYRETVDMLRALGYQHFCTFEGMRPTFHSLDD